jgi:hypothetical protein
MATSFTDSSAQVYTSVPMSKSSSSSSNTSIPTSPAETSLISEDISLIPEDISPLDGLNFINLLPFVGIQKMRGIVKRQSAKFERGDSDQQYLTFTDVSVDDLAKIDRARNSIGKGIRMTHYTDIDLLIVKLPSAVHERAHGNLATDMIEKVVLMGMRARELDFVGASRFRGRRSSKEGDSAYKPQSFRPNDPDWPTIVIESGVSESLHRLRFDAGWWLTESGGDVKIVIIISIQQAQSRIQIEKWEHAPSGRPLPLRTPPNNLNNNPNNLIRQIPTKVQNITIVSNTVAGGPLPAVIGGPFTVTGAPLVLEFNKIFLRPAVLPETDITFNVQELSAWVARLI